MKTQRILYFSAQIAVQTHRHRTNTIGAATLGTVWTDPDFDPDQKVFYYARMIEIWASRQRTYDPFRFGIEFPERVPTSTRKRAFTSSDLVQTRGPGS